MDISHSLARLAGRLLRQPTPEKGEAAADIRVESSSFGNQQPIPHQHSGAHGRSPALRWSSVPAATEELVLLVEDPDAPTQRPFVHWVVYGIAPNINELDEGLPPTGAPLANGVQQGMSELHRYGFLGPSPPAGHGVHHYYFQLFALDRALDLEAPVDRDQLLDRMRDHVIASGELVGTFENK